MKLNKRMKILLGTLLVSAIALVAVGGNSGLFTGNFYRFSGTIPKTITAPPPDNTEDDTEVARFDNFEVIRQVPGSVTVGFSTNYRNCKWSRSSISSRNDVGLTGLPLNSTGIYNITVNDLPSGAVDTTVYVSCTLDGAEARESFTFKKRADFAPATHDPNLAYSIYRVTNVGGGSFNGRVPECKISTSSIGLSSSFNSSTHNDFDLITFNNGGQQLQYRIDDRGDLDLEPGERVNVRCKENIPSSEFESNYANNFANYSTLYRWTPNMPRDYIWRTVDVETEKFNEGNNYEISFTSQDEAVCFASNNFIDDFGDDLVPVSRSDDGTEHQFKTGFAKLDEMSVNKKINLLCYYTNGTVNDGLSVIVDHLPRNLYEISIDLDNPDRSTMTYVDSFLN